MSNGEEIFVGDFSGVGSLIRGMGDDGKLEVNPRGLLLQALKNVRIRNGKESKPNWVKNM